MAIQFILGRSGTGKTRFCLDRIIEELKCGDAGQNLILLVPEQATYQAEKSILSDGGVRGYSRLYVLSFARLEYILTGRKAARSALSSVGRQMMIGRILRANRDKLKVFGGTADKAGLAEKLALTVEDFLENGYGPGEIREILADEDNAGMDRAVRWKLEDVELAVGEYLKAVEGKFLDPVVQMKNARSAVGNSDMVRGARLWVDGFSGFSGNEMMILRELFRVADRSEVAMCLDPEQVDIETGARGERGAYGVFYPTEKTYASLLDMRREEGFELIEPVLLKEQKRFGANRGLEHLERGIFEAGEVEKVSAGESVKVYCAGDLRSEVEGAARKIKQLVKSGGFKYSDVAMVVSDMNAYEHYVRAAFDDLKVPYFIDKRRPLNQHSCAEMVMTALKIASGVFETGDVLAYLKTGLAGVEEEDIDLLENYCRAFGIEGKDWKQEGDWEFEGKGNDFDGGEVNRVKNGAVEKLWGFVEDVRGCEGEDGKIEAGDFIRCVFDLIERLGVRDELGEWSEKAMEDGDVERMEEHRQFFEKFVGVFDEFWEVLSGERLGLEDFAGILRVALADMKMAFIPPGLDQVMVGTIDRSRHPDLKAVFIVGATAKSFPAGADSSGILNDKDRELAEGAGFELAASRKEKLAERQYLGYIAFTRASDKLVVSYPASDGEGKVQPRSSFVGNLESCFNDVEEENLKGGCGELKCAESESDFEEVLCETLGKASEKDDKEKEICAAVLEAAESDDELSKKAERVRKGIGYSNSAELERGLADEYYKGGLRSSASGLGSFAKCPYQFFAKNILKLKVRKEFKIQPMDLGEFYHWVMEKLVEEYKERLAELAEGEIAEAVDRKVSDFIERNVYFRNFVSHNRHNSFMFLDEVEKLKKFVRQMVEVMREGSLRPVWAEMDFGLTKDGVGALEIEVENGKKVYLRGKIDRVDVGEVDGEKTAIVFDYKRSEKSFRVEDVYYGMDLQLPLYMLALKEKGKEKIDFDRVGGAFFVPMNMSPGSVSFSKYEGYEKRMKIKGIFDGEVYECLEGKLNGRAKFYSFAFTNSKDQYGYYNNSSAYLREDFEAVLEFGRAKIIDLSNRIMRGEIGVRPYRIKKTSPCGYCDYRGLCRFDWQVNEYNFLEPTGKKEEAIAKIQEALNE